MALMLFQLDKLRDVRTYNPPSLGSSGGAVADGGAGRLALPSGQEVMISC
jgi:hypothetical protein